MGHEPAQDPWVGVTTTSGLRADEVISTLQKEIRRGNTENASLCAHEMTFTSPALEEMLWQRLRTISVEDIGMGEPLAPVVVDTLDRFRRALEPDDRDRFLFAVHAVHYLATRTKDRSSDELTQWIRRAANDGGAVPAIPDYALDLHTEQGRQMGRGRRHFLEEASRITPESPNRDLTYRDRLVAGLDGETG